MGLLSRLKNKRLLSEALKNANQPMWYVEYETQDGDGLVNVYANSYKSAIKNADSIIRIQDGNKPYAIKSVSAT